MLLVEDVHVSYGGAAALQGISLEVRPGEIVALIGANGAGKTTTLKLISGLVRARKGRVRYNGQDLADIKPANIIRRGISHSREGRQLFIDMTVYENLLMGGFTIPKSRLASRVEQVLELFPAIRPRLRQLAGTLSGGEQQMVALMRALVSEPNLLLLDEPSLGLSPAAAKSIFAVLPQLAKAGMSVLLVEQNAHQALAVSHRGYVLEVGKVVLEGTSQALQADERLQAAYLGKTSNGIPAGQ